MLKRCTSLLLLTFLWVHNVSSSLAQEGDNKILKNDFKVTLLSLGSGSSRFTYERAFSPTNSVEYTLGVIGWGWNFINQPGPRGFLLKYANKWTLIPQQNSNSWLGGFYVKPEVVIAHFNYLHKHYHEDSGVTDPIRRFRTTQGAILGEIGYQLVLWDWFDFDIYAGLGPSMGTGNHNNYYHSFMIFDPWKMHQLGVEYKPDEVHLAFTAGFRIGIAF